MTNSDVSGLQTVISGVGAGVKGAYVQMVGSASQVNRWMYISMGALNPGLIAEVFWDLATGAAASEVDDYPNIYCRGSSGATQNFQIYCYPIFIPASTRIAIRIQDGGGPAETYWFHCTFIDTNMPAGLPTATESFLPPPLITTPASAGSDGPWFQIVASLAQDVDYFKAYWCSVDGTSSQQNWDIGTGVGGSEVERLNELGGDRNKTPTRQDIGNCWYGPLNLDSGLRVAVRAKTNVGIAQRFQFGGFFTGYA